MMSAADRAAEVEALMARALDPEDEYDGSDLASLKLAGHYDGRDPEVDRT